MTRPSPEFEFDVSSAINKGKRDYQEDAIITDFPLGSDVGFAVLSDGMGGHAAGDIASKIVVTEVFSELLLKSGSGAEFEDKVHDILLSAASAANECVKYHVSENPDTAGMGATLVAPVIIGNQLFWVSVGDSPLYLYRDGSLRQLNEDHSMAPQIDMLVAAGELDAKAAAVHPDRNCLTSALIGDQIPRIDCPKESTILMPGDVLIVASDGLQFLSNQQIELILEVCAELPSKAISEKFLEALVDLGDPDQDNISFSVIKVSEINNLAANAVNKFDIDDHTSFQFRTARSAERIGIVRQPVVAQPTNLFLDYSDFHETGH